MFVWKNILTFVSAKLKSENLLIHIGMCKKKYYLRIVGGIGQLFFIPVFTDKFSDLAFRLVSGGFFMPGSFRILSVVKQIVGQKKKCSKFQYTQAKKEPALIQPHQLVTRKYEQKDRLITLWEE